MSAEGWSPNPRDRAGGGETYRRVPDWARSVGSLGGRPHDDFGSTEPEGIPVPTHWPSAWPHLWHATRDRAVFVAAVIALTVIGIVGAGDLQAQWWVPLLPLVLLAGPATRPGRVRRALQNCTARGRLRTMPGRLQPGPVTSRGQTVRLITSSGASVTLPTCDAVARSLVERDVGQPVLLVWAPWWAGVRGAAAIVLGNSRVAYLRARPSRARHVGIRLRLTAYTPSLVRC